MIIQRVPECPDCGHAGRRVKGSWFYCPECGSNWEEINWADRIEEEFARLAKSDTLMGVNSCIVIDKLKCDGCGRIMKSGEKYCYDSRVKVSTSPEEILWGSDRGKRFCVRCSLKSGFMVKVRNIDTDKVYPVMFPYGSEERVPMNTRITLEKYRWCDEQSKDSK